MRALLLAAGLGTRLRPLTNDIPKCLVPIHGRPLLDYWLEMLFAAGIKDILINLHYFPEQVTKYLANSAYQGKVQTVFERNLLGTAGTVRANLKFCAGEDLILIHADNLSRFSMKGFVQAHLNSPAESAMTMMVFETDDPKSCGIVELDEKNMVIGFHEKVENPPGNLANGAVYILKKPVIDFIASFERDFIDFSNDVIPKFIGRIYAFKNDVYHRDIGNLESYNRALIDFPRIKFQG